MTHDPTFWLLARASGLTAYGLLTSAVLAGLLLKARPFGAAVKPATAVEVTRPPPCSRSVRSPSTALRSCSTRRCASRCRRSWCLASSRTDRSGPASGSSPAS